MRHLIRNTHTTRVCVLSAMLIASLRLGGFPTDFACDDGVKLQIFTDRTSYEPGASMHVKLLITNTGRSPIFLFHGAGQCSSPVGQLSLDLRDQHNNEVEGWACFADDFQFGTRDVVEILTNSESGVFLREGETYGSEGDFLLPRKKGIYRLHAETAPARLTNQQQEALKQHHMRVLNSTCLAPAVSITLK